MYVGIPDPYLQFTIPAPARPSDWVSETPGYYFVDYQNGSDVNTYGSPVAPRKTIPNTVSAGSRVEIFGDYPNGTGTGLYWKELLGTEGDFIPGVSGPVWVIGTDGMLGGFTHAKIGLKGSNFYISDLYAQDGAGIQLGTSTKTYSAPVTNAVVRYCDLEGTSLSLTGGNPDYPLENVVVYKNHIHHGGDLDSLKDNDTTGVQIQFETYNIWVLDNHIHDMDGAGVQVIGSYDTTKNIYIGGNHVHHVRQSGIWKKYGHHVVVSTNIVHDIITTPWSPSKGIGAQYEPTDYWIINNLIYNCSFGVRIPSTTGGLPYPIGVNIVGNIIHSITPQKSTIHEESLDPTNSWGCSAINLVGSQYRNIYNNLLFNNNFHTKIAIGGSTTESNYKNNIFLSALPYEHNGETLPGVSMYCEGQYLNQQVVIDNNYFDDTMLVLVRNVPYTTAESLNAAGARGNISGPALFDMNGFLDIIEKSSVDGYDLSALTDKGTTVSDLIYDEFVLQQSRTSGINSDIFSNQRIQGEGIDIGPFELGGLVVLGKPDIPSDVYVDVLNDRLVWKTTVTREETGSIFEDGIEIFNNITPGENFFFIEGISASSSEYVVQLRNEAGYSESQAITATPVVVTDVDEGIITNQTGNSYSYPRILESKNGNLEISDISFTNPSNTFGSNYSKLVFAGEIETEGFKYSPDGFSFTIKGQGLADVYLVLSDVSIPEYERYVYVDSNLIKFGETVGTTVKKITVSVSGTTVVTVPSVSQGYIGIAAILEVSEEEAPTPTSFDLSFVGNIESAVYDPIVKHRLSISNVLPADAVIYPIYVSSDLSVVSIATNGNVTTVGAGTATIQAIDTRTNLSASVEFTVTKANALVDDSKFTVNFSGLDGSGYADLQTNAVTGVTFTMDKNRNLSIGDVIVVTATPDNNHTLNGDTVPVSYNVPVTNLSVIDYTLTSFTASMPSGVTSIKAIDGQLVNPITISAVLPTGAEYNMLYSTTTPNLVSVSSTGLITPVKVGTATILVTDEDTGISRTLTFQIEATDIPVVTGDYSLLFFGENGSGNAILDSRNIQNLTFIVDKTTGLSNGDTVAVSIVAAANYTVNGESVHLVERVVSGLSDVDSVLRSFSTRLSGNLTNPKVGVSYQVELYDVLGPGASVSGAIYTSNNTNALIDANGRVTIINKGIISITVNVSGIISELELVALNDIKVLDEDITVRFNGKSGTATASIVSDLSGVDISVYPNTFITNGDILTVTVSGDEYDSINGVTYYTYPYLVAGLARRVTSFVATTPNTFVGVGSDMQIDIAGVLPEGVYLGDAEFSTSNDEVLTVTIDGRLRGISTGSAIITVKIDNVTKSIVIDVIDLVVKSFSVLATTTNIAIGKTTRVNVYNVLPVNADVSSLVFTSSSPAVAAVDGYGTVTGRTIGMAIISATINGIAKEATVFVSAEDSSEVVIGTQYDVTDEGVRYPIAKATVDGNLVDSDSNRIYGFVKVSTNEWRRSVSGETLKRIQTYGGEYAYPQYTTGKVYIGMRTYNGKLINLSSDVILGYSKDEEGLYYIPVGTDLATVVIPQYDNDTGKYFGYLDGNGILRSHDKKNISNQYAFISGDKWMANGIRLQYDEKYRYDEQIGKASASGKLLDNQGNVIYGFIRTAKLTDNTWSRFESLSSEAKPLTKLGIQYYVQYTPELDVVGYASFDGVLRDKNLNEIVLYDKDNTGRWVINEQLNGNDIRIPRYSKSGKLVGYSNGLGTLVTMNGSLIDNYAEQSDGTWVQIEPPKPLYVLSRDYQLKTISVISPTVTLPENYLVDIINQSPSESRMTFEFIADYIEDMTPGSDTPESEIIKWQERLYRYLIKLIREEENDAVAYENIRSLVSIVRANAGEKQPFNFRYIGRYAGQVKLSDAQKQEFSTLLYTLQELALYGNKVNIDWRTFRASMVTAHQDIMVKRITGAFNITNN
jgi:hypothetical protein